MDIVFTHHFVERKTERTDYLVSTKRYSETRKNRPRTERLLRDKGRWYCKYDHEECITRLYCIVNNLEVYCAILIDDEVEPYILITTYYPYTSKVKRKLFPKGVENFEPFEINSDSAIQTEQNYSFNQESQRATAF